MTDQIKELIAKINAEGVQAAEAKARQIEELAQKKAAEILARATQQAELLVAQAKAEISTTSNREKALLAQAGRDFLISLRQQIKGMLAGIIDAEVRQALDADFLARVLQDLIKKFAAHAEEIVVTLKKEDLLELEEHFLARLKQETKKGITLKPADGIAAGFTISFDSGKSQFDFTDKAIAEYIGRYLKPKLDSLLKEVV